MRIAGITIPEDKRIEIGLTAVYGIGRSIAHDILDEAKVAYDKKPKDINADQENAIREIVSRLSTEGDLKREVAGNIKRLKDIQSYRGSRHSKSLPSRGQRTKTNARTRKGPRKTMGSGKKKIEKK
jgi:small subunit ribosomal protein S13